MAVVSEPNAERISQNVFACSSNAVVSIPATTALVKRCRIMLSQIPSDTSEDHQQEPLRHRAQNVEYPMASPYLFLDTEFSDFTSPTLLSLGLVDQHGHSFYGELPAPSNSSDFVQEHVLSQWGRAPDAYRTPHKLGMAVRDWLSAYPSVTVCYDYHTDADLLEALLAEQKPLSTAVTWQHVGYLYTDENPACMALEWARTRTEMGIEQHHALADAYALRALFESIHGAPE